MHPSNLFTNENKFSNDLIDFNSLLQEYHPSQQNIDHPEAFFSEFRKKAHYPGSKEEYIFCLEEMVERELYMIDPQPQNFLIYGRYTFPIAWDQVFPQWSNGRDHNSLLHFKTFQQEINKNTEYTVPDAVEKPINFIWKAPVQYIRLDVKPYGTDDSKTASYIGTQCFMWHQYYRNTCTNPTVIREDELYVNRGLIQGARFPEEHTLASEVTYAQGLYVMGDKNWFMANPHYKNFIIHKGKTHPVDFNLCVHKTHIGAHRGDGKKRSHSEIDIQQLPVHSGYQWLHQNEIYKVTQRIAQTINDHLTIIQQYNTHLQKLIDYTEHAHQKTKMLIQPMLDAYALIVPMPKDHHSNQKHHSDAQYRAEIWVKMLCCTFYAVSQFNVHNVHNAFAACNQLQFEYALFNSLAFIVLTGIIPALIVGGVQMLISSGNNFLFFKTNKDAQLIDNVHSAFKKVCSIPMKINNLKPYH